LEVGSFAARLGLPECWLGLRDAELAAVSGAADSVFCRLNLFVGSTCRPEGAVQMTGLALVARA
jgi:uncharacterized UPF0160 family protein